MQAAITLCLLAVLTVWAEEEGAVFKCFESNAELRAAAVTFDSTSTIELYGLVSDWCVDRVADFSNVFEGLSSFNEPLRWNTSSASTMMSMFSSCGAFNQSLSSFDTSRVTSMRGIFYSAVSFTGTGLANWDTALVTDMNYFASGALEFEGDIGGWSVSNVETLYAAFYSARRFNTDLSFWTLPKANDLRYAFYGASDFRQNLCSWLESLDRATLVDNMFLYTDCLYQSSPSLGSPSTTMCSSCAPTPAPTSSTPTFVPTVPAPSVSPSSYAPTPVTCFTTTEELRSALVEYSQDQTRQSRVSQRYGWPMGDWCVDDITDFGFVFERLSIDEPLRWNTSMATSMRFMFSQSTFSQSVSSFDTSRVETMRGMFYYAARFGGDGIESFNLSSCNDTALMFAGARAFNGNVMAFDVSSVRSMVSMFESATSFSRDIGKWNVRSVATFAYMMYGATSFRQDLCSWLDVISPNATTTGMFANTACDYQQKPDPVDGPFCFRCSSVVSDSPSRFPTTRAPLSTPIAIRPVEPTLPVMNPVSAPSNGKCFVTNAELQTAVRDYFGWRYSAYRRIADTYGLIENWCVENVDDFSGVFRNLGTAFNHSLPGWNTSSGRDFSRMFYNTSFNRPVSHFDVSRGTNFSGMFQLAGGFDQNVSMWSMGAAEDLSFMFAGATNFGGALPWDVSRVTTADSMLLSASSFDHNSLSTWNVSSLQSARNFLGNARRFNQSLCTWGQLLSTSVDVTSMFWGSGCREQDDPDLSRSPPGPFCLPCTSSSNGVSFAATWATMALSTTIFLTPF